MSAQQDAAWEAHQAGIAAIPLRDDGSKAPAITSWAEFMDHLPDPGNFIVWWPEGSTKGVGYICGRVSKRLICLDIEARFWAEQRIEMCERLVEAGLWDLFESWAKGATVLTPSGGIHIWIHLMGDFKCPGNTKIALTAKGACLIETRGDGGYAAGPPSNGGVHPSQNPWTWLQGGLPTAEWVTPEDYDAVLSVLASFDETPPPTEPPPPIRRLRPVQPGDDWIELALDAYPSAEERLTSWGWTFVRDHGLGRFYRHPEAHNPHSARINQSGRVFVFTTASKLPCSLGTNTTYDAVDVELYHRLGRKPTLDERTAELRAYRTGLGAGNPQPLAISTERAATAETVALTLHKNDEWWQEYAFLDHVWRAALSAGRSPDTVWEAVKWGFAANIPFNFLLPDEGTFDYTAVMVGASGAGKTRSKSLGLDLLGPRFTAAEGVGLPIPPGTGEGMSEFFIRRNAKGQQATDKYKNRAAGYYVDEGELILRLRERAGSSLISSMKSAWSGELMGQTNASQDKTRHLEPRAVRNSVLISVTIDDGAQFLATDLSDGGFPQRISWAWAHYENWPRAKRPSWPGPLDIPHYPWLHWTAGATISYDDEIANLIADAQDELTRSPVSELGLEGHRVYSQLKIAGLLALMDARFNINPHDWECAGHDLDTSRNVRTYVGQLAQQHIEDRYVRAGQAAAVRAKAEVGFWMNEAVQKLLRTIDKCNGLATTKPIQMALKNYRTRQGIGYREVIEHAQSLGLVIWDEGTGVRRAR